MERNRFLFQTANKPEDIVEITSCLCVMGSESSNGISAFLRRTRHFGVSSLLVMKISEFMQQTVLMGKGWVISREWEKDWLGFLTS